MATTTTNFGWDIPQSTDLVKDGATAIAALGQDIDTAFVDLKGGTTGQVLSKATGTDLDFSWITPAAGGGKVLQVVQATTTTSTTVTSTTFTDSGLSATITPSSSSSKILVLTAQPIMHYRFFEKSGMQVRLMRGATQAFLQGDITAPAEGAGSGAIQIYGIPTTTGYVFNLTVNSILYLDSPATTSATTYKTQIGVQSASNSGTVIAQANNSQSSIILMEIGA